MLVPSKERELLQDAEFVFLQPRSFGVSVNSDRRLTLDQLLESLLVFDRWCFLTVDDLEDTLFRSEHFRISDRDVQYLGDIPLQPLESPVEPIPSVCFLPASAKYPFDETRQPVRLYETLRTALLVSANREGSFEDVRVMRIDTAQAAKHGLSLKPINHGIVLATQIGKAVAAKAFIKQVAEPEIKPLLSKLLYEIKFHETLFLEDAISQADAARYLFQAKPQEIVETELIAHLTHCDRYVRMNVLTALGLPAYSVGFTPGVPLPPKEKRIEPVILSPNTIRRILAWADTEDDPGVLDYMVCALKAQNYQGKLRSLSSEVRQVLRKTVPKLSDEQTIKDCQQLAEEINFKT